MISETLSGALFSLLRTALFEAPLEVARFAKFSASQWEQFFQLAQRQQVASIVVESAVAIPNIPRLLKLQWLAHSQQVEERSQQSYRTLAELLHFFNSHQIPTLLLKGPALSSLYPKPLRRPFTDLDIYQYDRWQEADGLVGELLHIDVSSESQHHTVYTYNHTMVENHYEFVGTRSFRSNKGYEALLHQLIGEGVGHANFHGEALDLGSPTFDALFLMRHMSAHFASERITLRHLCDWAMFLRRRGDKVQWGRVVEAFRAYGIMPFVAAVQGILEDDFGMSPIPELPKTADDALQQRIREDILEPEFAEQHEEEDLGRLPWKLRRFKANRWKYRITTSDPLPSILFRSIFLHLKKPKTILHKV